MKEEKYLELLKDNRYLDLKELLENNIKESVVLKTNSRSRLSVIKKMFKNNKGKPLLQGHAIFNNQYHFTDGYTLLI